MEGPAGARTFQSGRVLLAGMSLAALFVLDTVSCSVGGRPIGETALSGIEGRVSFEGKPLAGAEVLVYRSLPDYRQEQPAASFGPTTPSGDFAIALAPGRYYVAARGRIPAGEGRALFNFHGSNPVTVAAGSRVPLGLSLAEAPSPPRFEDDPEESGAGLSGVILYRGEPLPETSVYLYLGDEEDFKGNAYAVSPPTDGDGRFALSGLMDTLYYAVARKRGGNRLAGPLGPGDYYGFYPFNPLRLISGKRAEITIGVIAKADEPLTVKRGPVAAKTQIEGRIVDMEGRPMAELYAFVYPGRIMSHARPLAISDPTGADGRFVLYLEEGGKFFLGARQRYGTNPQPGEYYGKYTGTPDHSITVQGGAVRRGVTIVVERVLD